MPTFIQLAADDSGQFVSACWPIDRNIFYN